MNCHERVFTFFGGYQKHHPGQPQVRGVRPDIYDPTLNRAYVDMERHYGFVADPESEDTAVTDHPLRQKWGITVALGVGKLT
ncbi:hypothetical protein [Syntrophorhabdus aromaticivorans]|uniref:hypothetical protein n=1 Tax=Syntrophorhabdus aromaticivorans TaxID=328301 RepID=UPI000416FC2E|nr:hypothetical protein [Syntrophorhabdus aromaticivorans]